MATEVPQYPITWYHPVAGVVREFPDESRLVDEIRDLDTDDIVINSQQWLIDNSGRRIRLRIVGATLQRFEILPGRPPLPETLAQMRESAMQIQEDREFDVRTAILWARIGGFILAPVVLLGFGLNVVPLVTASALTQFSWDQLFVSVGLLGTAGILAAQVGRRRFIFFGVSMVLASGVGMGAMRGWELAINFMSIGTTGSLISAAINWLTALALPFAMFFVGGMLLVFFGRTYLALARRRY